MKQRICLENKVSIMKISDFIQNISQNQYNDLFSTLYGKNDEVISNQKERYIIALESFRLFFPDRDDVKMYSASGRTEIGGNHTDHQHGVVLAGAVNLDVIAVVSFHSDNIVKVKSEGYEPFEASLDDLSVNPDDSGTASIIKGVIAKYAEKGIKVEGFDMYCTSDVISGGGISSSASFETLICTIINNQYNECKSEAFEIAQIGWFAENVYFGKKCGLLDQTVAAFGGLVSIDFKDNKNPVIEKINFSFRDFGYYLCITDTKSSHANLTDDYDSITDEMKQVASCFGAEVLNDVDENLFYENIPSLRKTCPDRAILRAIHFFDETKRAKQEADALKAKDIHQFLKLVNESGDSSCALLQNLYSCKNPLNQEIPLAIALSKKILKDSGAVRVHGGGFAGTIQAFVPENLVNEYTKSMDKLFGKDSCLKLNVRPVGGVEIK